MIAVKRVVPVGVVEMPVGIDQQIQRFVIDGRQRRINFGHRAGEARIHQHLSIRAGQHHHVSAGTGQHINVVAQLLGLHWDGRGLRAHLRHAILADWGSLDLRAATLRLLA
jgi:hypothetical protein